MKDWELKNLVKKYVVHCLRDYLAMREHTPHPFMAGVAVGVFASEVTLALGEDYPEATAMDAHNAVCAGGKLLEQADKIFLGKGAEGLRKFLKSPALKLQKKKKAKAKAKKVAKAKAKAKKQVKTETKRAGATTKRPKKEEVQSNLIPGDVAM